MRFAGPQKVRPPDEHVGVNPQLTPQPVLAKNACKRLHETGPRKRHRSRRMRQPFPPGFLWGCATSAYQIEGSPLADGAGVSNWHRFVRTPGRVLGGAPAA